MSCHAISYHAIDIMRNGATGVRGAVSPSSLCGRGARIAGARAALGRLRGRSRRAEVSVNRIGGRFPASLRRPTLSLSNLCGRGARIAGARAALGRLPLTVGAARFVAAASGQCGQPAVVRLRRTLPLPKKLLAPPPTAEFVVVVVIVIMSCHVMPCHHTGLCWPLRDGRKDCGDRAESSRIGARENSTSLVSVAECDDLAKRRP